MPGRPHHTDKFRSCVDKVVASGKDEESAYAICTTSLQQAGEPIFEGAESRSAEEFRLLGDAPGHEFHGNQFTTGSPTERSTQAREMTRKANSMPVGALRETKAAAEAHKKAAQAHREAASVAKFEATKKFHEQTAAHHEETAALTYKSARYMEGNDSMRHLHLLGATGQPRTEVWNGKEYLVVPVVALMEGVIHAVNAETPELVPFATLEKAAASWNGKPVTLGHPKKDGKQCSAGDPGIVESHGIGVVRNSRVDKGTKKLLQEAWIEKLRAKKLHPEMFARLEASKVEEVSVGAFVVTDGKAGTHSNGREFKGSWVEADGDHLAFLPGGRGACSVDMGCGTHRAAMHLVTAEAIEEVPDLTIQTFTTLEGPSLDERIRAVNDAVMKEWNDPPEPPKPYAYAQQVFDDYVIVREGEDLWKVPYEVDKDGTVTLGKETQVKMDYVAAEMRVAVGARHSAKDSKVIQTMHDHSVMLGAKCDRGNYETAEEKPASSVRHEGGLWVVYSKDGTRRLGAHKAKDDAEAQAQAIARSLARQKAS